MYLPLLDNPNGAEPDVSTKGGWYRAIEGIFRAVRRFFAAGDLRLAGDRQQTSPQECGIGDGESRYAEEAGLRPPDRMGLREEVSDEFGGWYLGSIAIGEFHR